MLFPEVAVAIQAENELSKNNDVKVSQGHGDPGDKKESRSKSILDNSRPAKVVDKGGKTFDSLFVPSNGIYREALGAPEVHSKRGRDRRGSDSTGADSDLSLQTQKETSFALVIRKPVVERRYWGGFTTRSLSKTGVEIVALSDEKNESISYLNRSLKPGRIYLHKQRSSEDRGDLLSLFETDNLTELSITEGVTSKDLEVALLGALKTEGAIEAVSQGLLNNEFNVGHSRLRISSHRRLLHSINKGEYSFSHDLDLEAENGQSNFKSDVRKKFLGNDKHNDRQERKKDLRDKGAEKRGVVSKSAVADAIEKLASLSDDELVDIAIYNPEKFGNDFKGVPVLEILDSHDLVDLRAIYVRQVLKDLKNAERNRYEDLRMISRRQAEYRDKTVSSTSIKRTPRKKSTRQNSIRGKKGKEILTKNKAHKRMREEGKALIREEGY